MEHTNNQYEVIARSLIEPDPDQPRKSYSQESIKELSDNMKEVGQLQPITVRPFVRDGKTFYKIVFGERRFLAADIAGISTLDCKVMDLSDEQVVDFQASENLHREGISPLEESYFYTRLVTEFGRHPQELAARYGKSVGYINSRRDLALLVPKAKEMLTAHVLPLTAAEKLSILTDKQQTDALSKLIVPMSVNGEIKETFSGLKDLKVFFDNHIFTSLKKSDFDIEDENLLPCGSCLKCPKRTGANTLFADITEDDKCRDNSCFHDKQVRHYQQLAFGLAAKKKIEIGFAGRSYGVEKLFKDLGVDIYPMVNYERITADQAKKEKNAKYVVFIGANLTDQEIPAHGWVKLIGKFADGGDMPKAKLTVTSKQQKVNLGEKILRDELYKQYLRKEENTHDSLMLGIIGKLWERVNLNVIPHSILKEFLKRYELAFIVDVFNSEKGDWETITVDGNYDHDPNTTTIDIKTEDFVAAMDQLNAKKTPDILCELEFLGLLSSDIDSAFMQEAIDIDVVEAKKNTDIRLTDMMKPVSKPIAKG